MRSLPTKPVITQPAKRQRNANPSTPMTYPQAQRLREERIEREWRDWSCCWSG